MTHLDEIINGQDLIIFEENLTLEGLERIKQEAEQYPVTADTKESYKTVYDQHQRFKRLHVAVRKKAEDLIKSAKSDFEAERDKINADLKFVLDVIEPIRDKLETARTDYEATEKAEKERLAREEAERQQAELKRQQEEQARLEAERLAEQKRIEAEQEAERKRLADEAAKVEAEKAALAYEMKKFQYLTQYGETFEIMKPDGTKELLDPERIQTIIDSRLDFDAAWDDSHPVEYTDEDLEIKKGISVGFTTEAVKEIKAGNRKLVTQEELDDLLGDDIQDEIPSQPSEPVPEVIKISEDWTVDADDLPISEDLKPSPMDDQAGRIEAIMMTASNWLEALEYELQTGFESQLVTEHLYIFKQTLEEFINTFPEK